MKRILKLSKYRNIGLDTPETLILNHSMDREDIGSLIILIGPNNSGKSNVLDALKSISSGQLTERDVTTLSFLPDDRKPAISFGIRDDEESIYYDVVYQENPAFHLRLKKDEQSALPTKEALLSDLKAASNLLQRHNIDGNEVRSLIDKMQDESKVTPSLVEEANAAMNAAQNRWINHYGHPDLFVQSLSSNGFWARSRKPLNNLKDQANEYCMHKFGVPFLPQIITYKERPLSNGDLHTTPAEIRNSPFFRSLFKAIDMNLEEIGNAYQQYATFQNVATLDKIKRQVGKKISKLNDRFNKLYFAETDKYVFSISLESNRISFGMARGKEMDPIMLEHQSTGFRWFFNLFFNFMCSQELKWGDIIIMDEPATNLHVSGQRELRAFMKQFAKENGLTFIIATHSPFLVDVDNFDELRVVSMENNRSKIDNLFSAVNGTDPDSLLPIKQSLTIEQNILFNLKTEVVWVEGITDYNYLTMFKNLLEFKNIAFLPYNGVGKDDDAQRAVLKRLASIEFHKKNLLVDADKAGQKMKELCKGTTFESVVSVSDINTPQKKFKEIEDLFSQEDRAKFKLDDKSSCVSSLMKNKCTLEDFSEETIDNFKELFEKLVD